MSRTIKVLLAEDQSMVREALAALLGLEADIEVVAQVARGDEVLEAAREHEVDVALLDIEMPGATGIEAAARLHEELPAVKLVILTTFGRPGYLRSAMESGADAFLVKDAPAAQLHQRRTGSHPAPLPGHRPQLPQHSHPEAGGEKPGRGGPSSTRKGLAVSRPSWGRGELRDQPQRTRTRTRTRTTTHGPTATRRQLSIARASRASPRTRSPAPSSTAATTSA
ncbi:hypothetical protein GCM10010270_55370 [Streptomyces violaceus]|nr:hypothetical protein GCM10010270_55370 [Streptomyces janthinus]